MVILLTSLSAISQTFPIVSTTQVLPPYSVYLSDYASASSEKLIANLFLQDQNQSGLQVKLRITITGDNGVKLETKHEFMPPPITMLSGLPERISGTDLQQYLEPANLNITGINPTQFAQSKKLPEGMYTFKVEAVEYRRNKIVSNSGMTVAWLILNDPPIWNLPQNNSIVEASNPQSIFFSWLPMHTGSPNSAFTTEYEFSLYDIIPQDRNLNEAVNTGIPIHQSTTMSTSFVYGAAEIPLEVGHKYAVRLKAYDTEGRDMFKNNGYSTVLVFTYGQECITPVGINHSNITPHTVDVSWTKIPRNTEFTIYYREKDQNGTNPWYEATTALTNVTIPQLKPEHTYQYTLKALCGSIESKVADIYEFTTPKKIVEQLECGNNSEVPVIDGSPPLDELLIGDVINVGGFEGIITQARGGNGVFSGKCIMKVTNFNILLKSHFTDLHVNQSYQVTQGNVIADRDTGIMINLDDIISELDSLANVPIDTIVANPNDFINKLDSTIIIIDPLSINDSIADNIDEVIITATNVATNENISNVDREALEDLIDTMYDMLIMAGYISSTGISRVDIKLPSTIDKRCIDENNKDVSIPVTCQYYPSYNKKYYTDTLPPITMSETKWIYLNEFGNINNIIAKIYPRKTPDSLKLVSSNISKILLSNPIVNKREYDFNLNSLTASDTNTYITMREDTVRGKVVNALNVITCQRKSVDLYIYLLRDSIKRKPPKINLSKIQTKLAEIYGSINIQFILHLDTVAINYKKFFDFNNNKKLDKSRNEKGESESLKRLKVDSLDNVFRVFIIDKKITRPGIGENQKIGGFAKPNIEPFGEINYPAIVSTYTISGGGEYVSFAQAVAHEIGHLVFGLNHPSFKFNGKGFKQGNDMYNIMDYPSVDASSKERKLRAYQVIYIEKNKEIIE